MTHISNRQRGRRYAMNAPRVANTGYAGERLMVTSAL
jgi:hypothetical protein